MKVKRKAVATSVLALAVLLTGCSSATSNPAPASSTAPQTQVITDAAGNQVTVPTKIDRIADGWQAHNEVVTMLGSGNKIVGTVLTPSSMPWLYQVNPQMKNAKTVFNKDSTANTEELLNTKADIVFVPLNQKNAEPISNLGFPTVQMNFTDFDGLKHTFEQTGDILGGTAKQRASDYVSYLNAKMAEVTSVTSQIPDDQRLKVLHVTSLSPLTVDGSNTIIDSWIKAAGGINAASTVQGNNKVISPEQLVQWDPDVVILGSTTLGSTTTGNGLIDDVMQNSTWQQTKAVANKKVYINPVGAFYWDRYSAEEALQIQWAAKTVYPDSFPNLNMQQETMSFYNKFFEYNLSSSEADRILNAEPPAKS